MARRSRRGGVRQGAPGVSYPERTDLNTNRQPVVTPPSQSYGQNVPLQAIQQGAPLPASAPSQNVPTNVPTDVNQTAKDYDFEGARAGLVPLDAPTERPNEPITSGLSTGPGPGPEALGPQRVSPAAKVMAYLASLPTATPIVRQLAYEVGKQELDPYA